MSPFSDTRLSQSIPKFAGFDLGFFCNEASISSAVSFGLLPVVSNSATLRLLKVFNESYNAVPKISLATFSLAVSEL